MTVLANDFRRQWGAVSGDALAAMERVGASGWYVLGEEVERFERALARAWGVQHAIGVASGFDALEIALRCAGIGAADRVLTTPLSAFATTLAVVSVGAVPVFVDVDASGLLDLDRCREALHRDPGIRCVVPVHLYGHALDLEALAALEVELGVTVVEDCAQSIGASWRGVPTGVTGRVAATSFYPTKNLGALGDGGAVLTASPELGRLARSLRNYGQTATYVHDHVGLNSRLDELQAAVLHDAMLPRLAGWTERRRGIAAAYRAGLANPHVSVSPVPAGSASIWHLFPVLVAPERRPSFIEHLRRAEVQARVHYPMLIPDQRALRDRGRVEVVGELRNAARFAGGEVSLPVHPFLTDEEVAIVIDACNAWDGA